MEFGVSRVLIQQVASALGSSERTRLVKIIGTGFYIYCGVSILPLLFGYILSSFVPFFFHIAGTQAGELKNAFIVASVGSALLMLSFAPASVIQGLQRQIVVNSLFLGGLTLGVLTSIILLYGGYGLIAIPVGSVVHAGVVAIGDTVYMFVVIRRDFSLHRLEFCRSTAKNIFEGSKYLLASNATGVASTQSSNVIIASMLNPLLCNTFTFTATAYNMLITLVTSMSHAVMPSLAHLAGEDDPKKLNFIVLKLVRLSILTAALALGGAMILNEQFVTIWVGSAYYGGDFLTLIFFVAGILTVILKLFNNVLIGLGYFRDSAWAGILEGAIHLPLMVLGAYLMGNPRYCLVCYSTVDSSHLFCSVSAPAETAGN